MSLDFKDAMACIVMHGYNKGYGGPDGALRSLCRFLPHALGEAIYKIVRYHQKGDPQDLIKAATWLEMEYDANHQGSRIGDSPLTGSSWGVIQRPRDSGQDSDAGNPRGRPGRGGDGPDSPSIHDPEFIKSQLEGRADPGSRRRKPVDKQHRPRKKPRRT